MSTFSLAESLGKALLEHGWLLATAESCTGGGIAAAITDISGSSQWFDRGFVTYSNEAKQEMLGVSPLTLQTWGAVSEQTVAEMLAGTLVKSRSQVAVAVSGVAGPTGGTADKPVGMVCLGWQLSGKPPRVVTEHFAGDRTAVREQAVVRALQGLLELLQVTS